MSKSEKLLRKIKRLEIKKANIEYKLDNVELEYNYWKAMEDDQDDWEVYGEDKWK